MRKIKPHRASSAPLTPIQMEDKNGRMVTRWVRLLPSGEPALDLPTPKSPVLTAFAKESFQKLFPEVEKESGYLIDLGGTRWFYTEDFVTNALESLPPRTLRKLNDTLTGEKTEIQKFLHLAVNGYLTALYNHWQDEGLAEVHSEGAAQVNNALLFHETLERLGTIETYHVGAGDYRYMLSRELARYEGVKTAADEEAISKLDYSSLPRRKQKEATAYLMASYLSREFAAERHKVNPVLVKFIYDHVDRQQDIIDLVKERGLDDVALLRAVMETEVPALSSGEL